MDMTFANWMGSILDNLFGFMYNIEFGYLLLLSVMFIGGVIAIYFRFFKNMIKDSIRSY